MIPPNRSTNPDVVAELAVDIVEMIEKRNVLNAEALMALIFASAHLATNCGCAGCTCGEKALNRTQAEIKTDVGATVASLFALECEARDL